MTASVAVNTPAWREAMSRAWQTLEAGMFDQAGAMFARLDALGAHVDAGHGRARALMLQGRHEEAEALVDQLLDSYDRVEEEALLAEILGRAGHRDEALLTLTSVLAERPDIAFYHGVMGEQLAHLGIWSKATTCFVEGFRRPHALPDNLWHIQTVVGGLSDAVAQGQAMAEDVAKMLQRITSDATNGAGPLAMYLATARRALHNRQAPPVPPRQAIGPVGRRYIGAEAANADQPAQPLPVIPSEPQRNSPRPPALAPMKAGHRPPMTLPLVHERRRHDVADAIARERELNEQLQANVATVEVPAWPSQQKEPIDTLAPVWAPAGRGGLQFPTMREQPASVATRGDIVVEIALDRCAERLLGALERHTSHPLVLESHTITQLELNLMDGVPLAPEARTLDFNDELRGLDVPTLGLGRLMGRCLEQTYGGRWTYTSPPEKSVLHIGSMTLVPMEYAARWLAAEDKDTVWLESLDAAAGQAPQSSSWLSQGTPRPDPTAELRGEALARRLAELWCSYRLALHESQFLDVADSLTILDAHKRVILFSINGRWISTTNDQSPSPVEWMAYERASGQFLRLSLRKHMARYLGQRFDSISTESGPTIVGILPRGLPPGWHLVDGEPLAREIRDKLQHPNVTRPALHMEPGRGEALDCWIYNGNGFAKWRLSRDSQRRPVWMWGPTGAAD